MNSVRKFAVIAISIIFIGAGLFWMQKTKPADSTGISGVSKPQKEFPYYDWQFSEGDVGNKIRSLVSVSLVDIGPSGKSMPRLTGKMKIIQTASIIDLRSSAYWSDGVNFSSANIISAFNRWKHEAKTNGWTPKTENEKRWQKDINIVAISKHQIKLVGFRDRSDLTSLLNSNLLRPIRKDLIDKDKVTAWQTTLGQYRIGKIIPTSELASSTSLQLEPNPKYFRGPSKTNLAIDLTKK